MPTAEVDGIGLSYSENGEGQPVVFVHGIPTDIRAWNAQVAPFSKKYRVIAYSRRHAHPNNNGENILESTIQNNTKDLEGLIRSLGLPPVHLIGHSYGGFIAAYLAAKSPELIKKLVLVEPGILTLLVKDPKNPAQLLSLLIRSPSTALSAGSFTRKFINPMLDAYHRGDLDLAIRLFADGFVGRKRALENLPQNVRDMLKENSKTIGEVETKLPIFVKKDAGRISAETLLVKGANGPKVLHAIVRELSKSMPNSEVVTIPDSGHFPHFEKAELFNEKVLEFLSRGQ
ncbi:MAG: alpha/beta hydrolase [Thaumarchaeota archaeon]|nr:alpha/beta hydrolase [Nitrososphaerota archaeon]